MEVEAATCKHRPHKAVIHRPGTDLRPGLVAPGLFLCPALKYWHQS